MKGKFQKKRQYFEKKYWRLIIELAAYKSALTMLKKVVRAVVS